MSKCKIETNGVDITTCDFLSECVQNNYGGFEILVKSATLREPDEELVRIAIAVKKTKNNGVELNYCPFCGENIDTSDYGIEG